jgi:hypothetical protein
MAARYDEAIWAPAESGGCILDQNLYCTVFRWRLGRSIAAVISEKNG